MAKVPSSAASSISITIDGNAIALHGLNPSDVHGIIETAIGGRAATEVYEGSGGCLRVLRESWCRERSRLSMSLPSRSGGGATGYIDLVKAPQ